MPEVQGQYWELKALSPQVTSLLSIWSFVGRFQQHRGGAATFRPGPARTKLGLNVAPSSLPGPLLLFHLQAQKAENV